MDADNEACRQNDTMFIVWTRHLEKYKTDELAARLAFKHLSREPVDAMYHSQGSFNRCYRVKLRDGPDVLVRFPPLGRSMFRQEKLEDDIAVMEYIASNTSIPIPRVLGHGKSAVGPYMILEFVEGKVLSEYLRASQDPKVPSTLNLDLDATTLREAYRGMAKILLELSTCRFPAIGGLVQGALGGFSVEKRAMTFNMNEFVGLRNFPPKRLSQHS
ncbi:phosphotransferase family protein [Arthroderma uncinatum]|uniref:phosphotransferase family protein n=1 Tax=Arthroderma uncinatum TaxID=74035 RepID=UPI00144AA9A1|nr:phosphotransferase family protein [Arthroderma uncinatum]KAF3490771.1 phosphotransferase family protein [Arthroderma uncinatum]